MNGITLSITPGTSPDSPPTLTARLKSASRLEIKGIHPDAFFFVRASEPLLTFFFNVGFN